MGQEQSTAASEECEMQPEQTAVRRPTSGQSRDCWLALLMTAGK